MDPMPTDDPWLLVATTLVTVLGLLVKRFFDKKRPRD